MTHIQRLIKLVLDIESAIVRGNYGEASVWAGLLQRELAEMARK